MFMPSLPIRTLEMNKKAYKIRACFNWVCIFFIILLLNILASAVGNK